MSRLRSMRPCPSLTHKGVNIITDGLGGSHHQVPAQDSNGVLQVRIQHLQHRDIMLMAHCAHCGRKEHTVKVPGNRDAGCTVNIKQAVFLVSIAQCLCMPRLLSYWSGPWKEHIAQQSFAWCASYAAESFPRAVGSIPVSIYLLGNTST
jgi:hypothetical protein